MPPNRSRRWDDEDDDRPRRVSRKRKKGPGAGAVIALVGGAVFACVAGGALVMFLLSGGRGGPDYGGTDGWRPGNVVANMHEFRSPAEISAKLGPGRVVPPEELGRIVLEETDANGSVTTRKTVAEYIRMPSATYYHWGTKSEDLYVAFPNTRDRLASSRAVWQGRDGKVKNVMTGSGGVE